MDDSRLPIRDYVLSQYEINSAELQRDYGLTYIETKQIIQKMLDNAEIIYKADLTYSVLPNSRQNKKVEKKNSNNEHFLQALWICISLNKVTARAIEKNLNIKFADALRLIEQMEKNGYISRSPERRVLISSDEYVYKFGRRSWIDEYIGEDVYVDNDGIICANPGPDIKEKLSYAINMRIGNSNRGENEAYVYNTDGNIMFTVQEMPDYIQITDRGTILEGCPLSRTKVESILKKQNKFIIINGWEITLAVKSYDYVLQAMMELYAAILAINCAENK